MTINVGTVDRIARAILGVVLLYLAFAVFAGGLWTWLAAIVGVVMLATAAMRSCPIYSLLGKSTCPRN
ncbi:YgaP family membrane protein [Roseivivax sp. CAU 1753]